MSKWNFLVNISKLQYHISDLSKMKENSKTTATQCFHRVIKSSRMGACVYRVSEQFLSVLFDK